MVKVFLSAGHGGSDPGATAYGLKEKDINLQTLLACKEVLENHGVTVVCSRTKDENDPVSQEVREANASKADLAVSFHANAGGGDGFEVFYYSTDKNGKRLAQLAEKHVKAIGQNSRGLKHGNKLMFVNSTNMTSVLFESFFVDNDSDKQIGDTMAEQKAFGVAYAKAILEYFNIAYKGDAVQSVKPQPTPTPAPTPAKKSIDEIAKEVIAGKWGNGKDRQTAITKAGYNYDAVQAKVNEILSGKKTTSKPASTPKPTPAPTPAKKSVYEIAQEVIAGKWGSGNDRKNKLAAAGYNYDAVQARVNAILGSKTTSAPAKKSINQVAREVIQGKWGNGDARRKALAAAGYDVDAVQKRVNEIL